MLYRLAQEQDIPQLLEMCRSQDLRFPDEALAILIGVDSQGVIHGMSALQLRLQIEPLISTNPIVAYKLASAIEMIASALGAGKRILAHVSGKKTSLLRAMQKLGYKVNDENMTILEKEA